MLFDTFKPTFSQTFFPFSNFICIGKELFSIKMKEIVKKLKIKVSGRVRVGVVRVYCLNKVASI